MVVFKKAIPRRTFVRGMGATLALPMLDAMTPALTAATKRPTRLAFMQVPNGIFNLNGEWTPKTTGANWEVTRTLEPLAAFKDRMVVISGLDNQEAAGLNGEVGGDHPRACTAWLTGTHAKMTSGADLRAGIMASSIGRASVAPTPRRNVRRGRALLKTTIAGPPHSKRCAVDDAKDDC